MDVLRPAAAAALPPKILVVDDIFENRELARMALEAEDYRVICAAGGEEALALFEAERPDCVLLDIRMPGLDGFSTCERLRAMPGGAAASIVFLTALRDVVSFDRAVKAGADDFLTKPILPTELVVRVRSQLELKRLDGALRAHVEVVHRQRDDLLRLQLQKEQLMGFLVHDLKNPVNSIDLHAQLLEHQKDLPEPVARSVTKIRAATRNLLALILEILDVGKGDEGRLEARRSAVDLAALLADIFVHAESRASAAGLTLSPQVEIAPGELHADVTLLRRVLENLLDNAVRHTPRGGRIDVKATSDDRAIAIVVADDGAGIPIGLRDRIFDRYVQVELPGSASGRAGRGLGLAFCRVAMEAHGGTISLDAGPVGAAFRLRFPRDR
jgi:two-component system sensor histidine kinase/response regulator